MLTIDEYLDEAVKLQGFRSDRALGRALEIEPTSISRYRKHKSYPSPETMIRLARLADVPREVALADLGYWTHFDTEAAAVYERIAKTCAKAAGFAACLAVLITFTPDGGAMAKAKEQSASSSAHSINYARKIARRIKRSLAKIWNWLASPDAGYVMQTS